MSMEQIDGWPAFGVWKGYFRVLASHKLTFRQVFARVVTLPQSTLERVRKYKRVVGFARATTKRRDKDFQTPSHFFQHTTVTSHDGTIEISSLLRSTNRSSADYIFK